VSAAVIVFVSRGVGLPVSSLYSPVPYLFLSPRTLARECFMFTVVSVCAACGFSDIPVHDIDVKSSWGFVGDAVYSDRLQHCKLTLLIRARPSPILCK